MCILGLPHDSNQHLDFLKNRLQFMHMPNIQMNSVVFSRFLNVFFIFIFYKSVKSTQIRNILYDYIIQILNTFWN
jgi:hypothetical protein